MLVGRQHGRACGRVDSGWATHVTTSVAADDQRRLTEKCITISRGTRGGLRAMGRGGALVSHAQCYVTFEDDVTLEPNLDASPNKLIDLVKPVNPKDMDMDPYWDFGLSMVPTQRLEPISHGPTPRLPLLNHMQLELMHLCISLWVLHSPLFDPPSHPIRSTPLIILILPI